MVLDPFSTPKPNFPSKAAVVIDGGYWRKLVEHLDLKYVDLVALANVLCMPAYRIRAYYFDGKKQHTQSFHDSLQLLNRFEVYLGELVPRDITCPHCEKLITTPVQKRVDVALAVELVHLATAGNTDLIVLIAGDRDFIPAIETAKHAGVIIRLGHGEPKTVSKTMYKLVDEKREITIDFLEERGIPYKVRGETELISKIQHIEAKSEKEKLRIESHVKHILVTVESLLLEMLAHTSKESILLSSLGIELSKREPNWKEKTKIKHLKSLLKLEASKYKLKEQDKQVYISTTKVIRKEDVDSAKTFILQVIKKFFSENRADSISLQQLGSLLSKKNPEWKKKYEVKQLRSALNSFEQDLVITGTKHQIRIKLK
ncbi:MAG: NYN domain-containing protein [Candidatus Hodarchaeales archaeon]